MSMARPRGGGWGCCGGGGNDGGLVEEVEDEDVLEDTSDLEDDADTIGADIVEVEPDNDDVER